MERAISGTDDPAFQKLHQEALAWLARRQNTPQQNEPNIGQ